MNDIVKIFGDARIAFRSDTLENWQKENPVLLSGEFSVVTDGTETEKVKIGDGKTPWNDLPWWKGPEGKQGPQGEKGEQGFRGQDGNDGTPATHSWNGTTLTITSASGTSSANLKGEKGDKGDKGEQGEKGEQGIQGKDGQDYVLTEADKQEIADMVDVPDIEADLSDYAKKEYVDDTVGDVETALDEIIEIQESLKDGYTGGTGGVSSWNDLTDKPFYDEGTKTATLDYANPPTVGIDFNGVFLGKVTDDILTADYINGAKLSLSFTVDDTVTDVSQELNTDTLMGFSFPFGSAYQFTDENITCMITVATQTGEFDLFGDGNLINIPETGTYLSFAHYSAVTNSISLTYTLIKTLEAKYLEIVSTTADTSVLAEQELSFTDDGNGMYQAMLGAIPLTAGKEYKVLWDGEEYVYEAIIEEEMIAIGSFATLNPFAIVVVEENATVCATSDASTTHTIAITEVGTCEIKQEYLPKSLYTEIDQRIENYINEALGGDY
jgi:hypothetical protein